MNRILVLGGTGFIGRSVCEKLVERNGGGGGRIKVATRRPMRAGDLWALPTVEVIRADVHDDTQLARLVARCDAVINLVGILHGSEAEFQRAHVELPTRLAKACRGAGVRRIVHVSAIGADSAAPSKYLRSKAAGEAALRQSGVELTLLRPSVVFGERDRFINLFARLQRRFPVLPLACADARFQPVWVEDLASAIAHTLDMPAAAGQLYELAGPTVYTLRELVQRAGAWSGHPRKVIALPDVLARIQAALFEMLPGRPLISRDNLDSMKVPNVVSGTAPGLAALGITPVALETVMRPVLEHRAGMQRLQPLRAHARRF
ncbi:MAG TPA: complex I NDUFA9 subunit family protein [Albitalea sp.]|nr:complex I NDUFA9 subunit family protein [Albitalea sp.]